MEKEIDQNTSFLVLGSGYVGDKLYTDLKKKFPESRVIRTSRDQSKEDYHYFDLKEESSYAKLPDFDICFWCFPPNDLELCQKFLATKSFSKLIVIGTTSSLLANTQIVTDSSELDKEHTRYQPEEFLITKGAKIVHAAGIYGPKRNPLDWLREKRVGPSDKLVNFIHRDDLAGILIFAAENFSKLPHRIIASDGQANSWNEIANFAKREFGIEGKDNYQSKRSSKAIEPSYLKASQFSLNWPDLFDALRYLEK